MFLKDIEIKDDLEFKFDDDDDDDSMLVVMLLDLVIKFIGNFFSVGVFIVLGNFV